MVNFWRPLSKKAMGFSLESWVIVETGHSHTANKRPSIFMGSESLKLILPSTAATWEPGIPVPGWRSPDRLKCDILLEIESLGMLRYADLLWPWNWQIPEKIEVWWPPEDQIPKQVEALAPPDWSWASPSSTASPVLGRIKGLQWKWEIHLRG